MEWHQDTEKKTAAAVECDKNEGKQIEKKMQCSSWVNKYMYKRCNALATQHKAKESQGERERESQAKINENT